MPDTQLTTRFAFIDDIQDVTLENGVRVLFLRRPEVPSVAIGCSLPVGSIHDPGELGGLANFAARGIGDGTPARTKEVLDETIDSVGGSYSFASGMEGSSGGMRFLAEHLPLAIELLADTLQHPLFPEEEVERGRKQITGSIHSQLEQPGDLCERKYIDQVFAGSPYGHNVDGEIASIAALDRGALTAFHSQYYRPAGAILAVAGDFQPDALLQEITTRFGDWAGAPPAVVAPAPTTVDSGIHTQLIDRPVQQAHIRLGWVSVPRSHPDYYPLILMNYIFGASSLSSRIAVSVRDNQGLAYQVVSRYSALEHTGLFTVVVQTSNSTANQALAGIRAEMHRMQGAVVTDEELDDARSHFRDRFPLTIETNGAMTSQLVHIGRNGFPLTHFRDHLEAIVAVTKDDILRAAQTYLQPNDFSCTVVAKLDEANIALATASAVSAA